MTVLITTAALGGRYAERPAPYRLPRPGGTDMAKSPRPSGSGCSAAPLAGFVLLLVGYFLFISPQRSQTSTRQRRRSAAPELQNTTAAVARSLRSAQNAHLRPTSPALAARPSARLPTTSGLPDFLRTLQSLGGPR